MKNLRIVPFLILMIWLGRTPDTSGSTSQYSDYEPILADRSVLNTIVFMEAKPIITTGKNPYCIKTMF